MLKIVEFVSRNKDNQGLVDFKQRGAYNNCDR